MMQTVTLPFTMRKKFTVNRKQQIIKLILCAS